MTFFARHDHALTALQTRGRYRALIARAGHDFASNDYLGLAGSDVLNTAARDALDRGVPIGAGGSRLLRGNVDEHVLLEREAAAFFGSQAALFMGGGFQANTAIFSTLPGHEDLVLYDALIHASTHDGMRLGRAETQAFAHNDVTAAECTIRDWRTAGNTGQIWIAVESLYSMDGDLAPLPDLMMLANAHDAVLIVDEAHATGVFGDKGRGLSHAFADRENLLTLHTCGKGLGVSGALICGATTLIDTLINKARGFIFATAPSPLSAAMVRAALTELRDNPARQLAAQDLMQHAHAEADQHLGLTGNQSQIMPIIIGADKSTMALAQEMQNRGYDIRGIRPPTVPRGTSRLRISITLNTTAPVISDMFRDLAQAKEATAT
ncbi:8-amino-7-oxononanoate synthase [Tropicibacter sp. Alg240-R139]|uniref:8-amino-7-oxononanoate synthase n=1 Tax=Tropicibacter sp. Alg240-R139 TaxID=2305991 RepID=UPI0013E0D7AA|nr:8-amino-7-oxononanoate synthase [Tropicibacter sp. Alg240-R139]